MLDDFDTDRWYWDRRTRKALYPRETSDGTVEFVTVWHAEEVTDALEGGALAPIETVGLDRTDTTFDLIESFRTPAHVENGPAGGDSTADSGGDSSADDEDDATADDESDSSVDGGDA